MIHCFLPQSVSVGVCMRVPFNRVVVEKAVKNSTEHVDIAGVSPLYLSLARVTCVVGQHMAL